MFKTDLDQPTMIKHSRNLCWKNLSPERHQVNCRKFTICFVWCCRRYTGPFYRRGKSGTESLFQRFEVSRKQSACSQRHQVEKPWITTSGSDSMTSENKNPGRNSNQNRKGSSKSRETWDVCKCPFLNVEYSVKMKPLKVDCLNFLQYSLCVMHKDSYSYVIESWATLG